MANLSQVSEGAFPVSSSYSGSLLLVFLTDAQAFLAMQNPHNWKTTVTSRCTLQAPLLVT